MKSEGLEIRESGVDPAQLDAYAKLLGKVFGPSDKFTPQAIAWRYRDNPAGGVVGMDAWSGDRLAAHYVTCPMKARIDGRVVSGLLSLNTATDPDFQGRGLFTGLAEAAYASGAAKGYEFVVGVANANSTPGFLRKLAFQDVGRLQAGVMLHAPRRLSDAAVQFEGVWDEALLRWRLANPAGRYAVGRSGDLVGVWAQTHLPLVRCGAFLSQAPGIAGLRGAPPLGATLFIGLEPRSDIGGGIIPLPERFRPSPLNLIWRRLGGAAPQTLRPDAVAFSFLDFDPY